MFFYYYEVNDKLVQDIVQIIKYFNDNPKVLGSEFEYEKGGCVYFTFCGGCSDEQSFFNSYSNYISYNALADEFIVVRDSSDDRTMYTRETIESVGTEEGYFQLSTVLNHEELHVLRLFYLISTMNLKHDQVYIDLDYFEYLRRISTKK